MYQHKRQATTEQMSSSLPSPKGLIWAMLGGIVLLMLIIAFIVSYRLDENVASTAASTRSNTVVEPDPAKGRLEDLNEAIKTDTFEHWLKSMQHRRITDCEMQAEDNLCVICLDEIKNEDSIRALDCEHIYHTNCFDRWFRGFGHDFCPLCHRRVIVNNDNQTTPTADIVAVDHGTTALVASVMESQTNATSAPVTSNDNAAPAVPLSEARESIARVRE